MRYTGNPSASAVKFGQQSPALAGKTGGSINIIDISAKWNTKRKEHGKQKVKGIVYHYTQGHSIQSSLQWVFKDSTLGASCHYWIARDGRILQAHAPTAYVWHAGTPKCDKKGSSRDKVGVEVALWYDEQKKEWEKITPEQINAVKALTVHLHKQFGKLKHYDHGNQSLWCKTPGEGLLALNAANSAVG